jgi:hypothetical protein
MKNRTHTNVVRALVTVSVAMLAGLAHAQPEYDFVHFDYPGAGEVVLSDINDQGVACGRIGMNTGAELGFVWSQATGITIVPVYKPQGLNNSGLVVGLGTVHNAHTAQSWSPPGLAGTYGPPTFGDADDTGVVVGAISTSSGSDSNGVSYIPYLWDAVNGARTLPIPNARGLWRINNAGVAIGWLYNSSTNDGFSVDVNTGAYTVLADIFPSTLGIGPVRASGINDLGQIVGSRASAAFPIQRYGYIYTPGTGFQMLPFPGAGYLQAVTPVSINNAGTVVGTLQTSTATEHVFVYSAANGLRDLWNNHTLIAGMPAGYQLHYAAKVNNQGWIAGWGYTATFHQTSFVLKPIANACPADLDNGSGTGTPDGGVDINDLLYFLLVFEAGTTAADLDNGSGTGTPDGGVDINDLLYFLVRFEAGC